MSDTLFDLAVICPECGSENVIKHWQTIIEGKTMYDKVITYHCDDCLTWFAPGEGVTPR